MIEAAKREADAGRAVYVVMATRDQADQMQRQIDYPGINFEWPSSTGNFDWDTMRLLGAHPNCVVLVDHFAIETRFKSVLEMLHQFDPPVIRVE